MSTSAADYERLRDSVAAVINQLCRVIGGDFEVTVRTDSDDVVVQQLEMSCNLVLDAARRSLREKEEIVHSAVDGIITINELGDMLRGRRKEWDMTFVPGGEEACEVLARDEFDVLVTDMRMPGMDGAALLAHVQKAHPSIVRIVLSGHTELEAALRAIPVAHQFLTKPCEAATIHEVVSRACNLQALLEGVDLRSTLGSLEGLPPVPKIYNRLVAALADPEVDFEDVAKIVEQDPAIAAKILQLVNSSFFGASQSISSLRQATTHLGLNMIRNITLSTEVFRTFEGKQLPAGFAIEQEQQHSLLTARIARQLVPDRGDGDAAFLAGILHDIGKLVLAANLPEVYAEACRAAAARASGPLLGEVEVLGITHAEIGAYLLDLWGMPYPIVEAVANHHYPGRVEHSGFDVVGAVHVADALSREAVAGDPQAQGAQAELDLEYLEAVGVSEQLPAWRELASCEATAEAA